MKWYRKKNKRESIGELEQQRIEKLAELGAQLWLKVSTGSVPGYSGKDPDSAAYFACDRACSAGDELPEPIYIQVSLNNMQMCWA